MIEATKRIGVVCVVLATSLVAVPAEADNLWMAGRDCIPGDKGAGASFLRHTITSPSLDAGQPRDQAYCTFDEVAPIATNDIAVGADVFYRDRNPDSNFRFRLCTGDEFSSAISCGEPVSSEGTGSGIASLTPPSSHRATENPIFVIVDIPYMVEEGSLRSKAMTLRLETT